MALTSLILVIIIANICQEPGIHMWEIERKDRSHVLYPFIFWCTFRLFPYLGNNAAVTMGVHISLYDFDFIFFENSPKSGITGLYNTSIFNLLWNFHTDFHSGYNSLYSHQQFKMIPFSPFPLSPSSKSRHWASLRKPAWVTSYMWLGACEIWQLWLRS